MLGAVIEGSRAHLCGVVAYNLTPGFAGLEIAGLPEAAARETRVRVRAALAAASVETNSPRVRVEVTSDGGEARGAALDLAVALACLPEHTGSNVLAFAELSLSGDLRPARGVLAALEAAHVAGIERAIVSMHDAELAAPWLERWPGLSVYAAHTLTDAIAAYAGERRPITPSCPPEPSADTCDLADLRGCDSARWALEIAAAGQHSMLLIGPPGAGKTMVARRLSTILPPLEGAETFDVACTQNAAGLSLTPARPRRPFRAPHHTASHAALAGGGKPYRTGEIGLARGGVLFLDELPEFSRAAIDAFGRELAGNALARLGRDLGASAHAPLFVAAMNLCPCGWAGDDMHPQCKCTPELVDRYRARVRPIAKLFPLLVPVTRPSAAALKAAPAGESSATVRERVIAARAILASVERAPAGLERVAQTIAALRGRREVTEGDRLNASTFCTSLD